MYAHLAMEIYIVAKIWSAPEKQLTGKGKPFSMTMRLSQLFDYFGDLCDFSDIFGDKSVIHLPEVSRL